MLGPGFVMVHFCNLSVVSSSAIILLRKREQVALL